MRNRPARSDSPLATAVDQVCIVCKDFERTLSFLTETLRIGPFKCWDFDAPALFDRELDGRPAPWSMRVGIAFMGRIQFEVIQPVGGPSVYTEHISTHGTTLHHLLLDTGALNLSDSIDRCASVGWPMRQSARLNLPLNVLGVTFPAAPSFLARWASTRFCYVGSEQDLGTTVELAKFPPGVSRPLGIRIGKAHFFRPASSRRVDTDLEGTLFDRIISLGFVTADRQKMLAAYRDKLGLREWKYAQDDDGRSARSMLGDLSIEIVEPASTDDAYGQVLASHGEGLRVIGLATRTPTSEARAALAESGLKSLAPGLYDARSHCGCVLRLA